ncbi:MAG TPA: hypothetical protein VMR33_08835 [Candidatus Baltobacteraceae bacterium]|jgi:hypothetical protein|nr:hypothetical protein [Candidatus Baltobacteraceae bacterium]
MKNAILASLLITGLLSSSARGQVPHRPSIQFPANNTRVTTNQITVSGTTKPGSGVTSVQYTIDGNGPITATQLNDKNWNNWEAAVPLMVGSNRFQVWADGPGGASISNSANYFMVVTNSIAILTFGKGAETPNLNGKELVIDKDYKILAVPDNGQFFAGWTGSVTSAEPKLTFLMQSNMHLIATFVPNPFTTNNLTGLYGGLFWDTNNPSETNAGLLTMTLADDGNFGGQISVDGGVVPFDGRFDTNGAAQLSLHRYTRAELTVSLALDLNGVNGLTGTVASVGTNGSGAFAATLEAYRELDADHIPRDFGGNYTVAMNGAGNGNPSNAPQGFSYGTASVGSGGHVNLHLFLSDGTTAITSGDLTGNGYLPLYVSLYAGRGSALGWIAFTNGRPTTNYEIFWFKEPVAGDTYVGGFSLTNRTVWIDPHKPPAGGANVLGLTNAVVQFTGSDLAVSLSDPLTLNAEGVGSGANTNVVKLTVHNQTGLFKGSFIDPTKGQKVLFHGAALESMRQGLGYFMTDDGLSGAVVITAALP